MPAKSKKTSSRNQAIFIAVVTIILALGVIFFPQYFSPSASTTPPTTAPESNNAPPVSSADFPKWLKVYFTNPNPPDNVNNGIDQYVVPVLNGAKQTIDLASFDLNLPSVVNALIEASKRGVKVRVVVDDENGEQELDAKRSPDGKVFDSLKVLKAAKIPVVDGGRSNGLMHNKIIIVDGQTLFMGSWNTSYNDTFRNNNNLLQITAPVLIANYQAKFNEMYVDKRFGAKAEVGAQTPSLSIEGVAVENYFSTADNVMAEMVKYVQGAKKSIKFIIFTYTHADLSSAMIAQAKKGIEVRGVIENRGASQGAMVPLYCAKLPVTVDGNSYTMHHKVIIIDDETVITGSYNFTKSANEANDDNALIIHNSAVAALYLQEFERIIALSKPPDATDYKCP